MWNPTRRVEKFFVLKFEVFPTSLTNVQIIKSIFHPLPASRLNRFAVVPVNVDSTRVDTTRFLFVL